MSGTIAGGAPGRGALVVLDRDGVLNRMVPRPSTGEPFDSPLFPEEVQIVPGVPALLRRLGDAGFRLAIASNQPAAAKGKTTRAALEAVHARVLAEIQAEGARIASSHVCYHRAEDGCPCRKPRPGLLEAALAEMATETATAGDASPPLPSACWMVGDRATDVLAGAAVGFATALVAGCGPGSVAGGDAAGAAAADAALLRARGIEPSFRGADLQEFVAFLLEPARPSAPTRR